MSRLIDADALKKLRHNVIQGLVKFDGSEYDLIDKCPTVDAVPVVRCRECKYRKYDDIFGMIWCNHDYFAKRVKSDDFCSYGERKEGADNA